MTEPCSSPAAGGERVREPSRITVVRRECYAGKEGAIMSAPDRGGRKRGRWAGLPSLPKTNLPPSGAHLAQKQRAADALAKHRAELKREVATAPDFVVLTARMINAGRVGEWNRQQLEALGVPWPPPAGWADRLVGKMVVAAEYQRFLAARGATKARRKPRI